MFMKILCDADRGKKAGPPMYAFLRRAPLSHHLILFSNLPSLLSLPPPANSQGSLIPSGVQTHRLCFSATNSLFPPLVCAFHQIQHEDPPSLLPSPPIESQRVNPVSVENRNRSPTPHNHNHHHNFPHRSRSPSNPSNPAQITNTPHNYTTQHLPNPPHHHHHHHYHHVEHP
jgi:hypothetical protein